MKSFNKKFGMMGWLLLIALITISAKIGDDILRVGTKTGADIEMQMGEGRIKWDSATSKMKFSNDSGVTEKEIGSGAGGGGGQNFFENGDAEGGLLNWNNVGGGTFVTFSATPINGLNSFRWDASAQNDVIRTDQIAIPEKFKGQACQIEFVYTGGTDDLVKPQVVDSGDVKLVGATYANQVDGTDFLQAQTGIVTRSIFFLCPSSGTIAFEFNQTAVGNPAAMDFDDVHIGELKGLVESVLPDVFSGIIDSGCGGVFSQSGDQIASAASGGTGICNVSLNAGLTIKPSCSCSTDSTGAHSCNYDVSNSTGSTLRFRIFVTDTFAVIDKRISIKCQKQGVDAKQTVQIFQNVPKVAENENNFSAKFNSAGVLSSENVDFILGNCVNGSTGNYDCDFVVGLFGVAPACTTTPDSVAEVLIPNANTTRVLINIKNSSGANTNSGFDLKCSRQAGDYRKPTVQPILVNQVETSRADGIRTEHCLITNSAGTPIIDTDSGLCEGWISSITDGGLGDWTFNIITGTFSKNPICTLTVREGSDFCASFGGASEVTTSAGRFLTTVCSTAVPTDRSTYVSCTGVR